MVPKAKIAKVDEACRKTNARQTDKNLR